MTKFIAFSDNHGNVEAIKEMKDIIKRKNLDVDFLIGAGDFTNSIFHNDQGKVKQTVQKIDSIIEELNTKFLYVRGNRDITGFKFENGTNIENQIVEINNLKITGDRENFDKADITVRHSPSYRKGIPQSLLHIEGHIHTGIFSNKKKRYFLNTGFLYKGGKHNANDKNQGLGGFFKIEVGENNKMSHEFMYLPDSVMSLKKCSKHKGYFYTPWNNCPFCYDDKNQDINYLKDFLKPTNLNEFLK